MSAVEEEQDLETVEAVREELETLRVAEGISQHYPSHIGRVLEAMAQIWPKNHRTVANAEQEALNEIQETVMVYPWKVTG
jgi:hypothetical protein